MIAESKYAPEVTGPSMRRPAILSGMHLLIEAHEYAAELDQRTWEFAVEIQSLCSAGMTRSDLRWLRSKGFVDHATEVTTTADGSRVFRPDCNLRFNKRTCFVLTSAGLGFADELRERGGPAVEPAAIRSPAAAVPRGRCGLPVWDRDRQELRLDGTLIKRFKAPAPNQEAILSAFEEEGWPVRIDDPIPPQLNQDPKRRLHDTINALNRNQHRPSIHFMGDGRGLGVRWELLESSGGFRPWHETNGKAVN